MKAISKTLVASALSIGMVLPAFASNSVPVVEPVATKIAKVDTQRVFAQEVKGQEIAALSTKEMKETEGAWVNWAVGGLIGGAGYAYGVYNGNYQWNTARFAGNVATGALIGGTFGAAGAAAGGGLSVGANVWRANGLVTNWGVNRGWRR